MSSSESFCRSSYPPFQNPLFSACFQEAALSQWPSLSFLWVYPRETHWASWGRASWINVVVEGGGFRPLQWIQKDLPLGLDLPVHFSWLSKIPFPPRPQDSDSLLGTQYQLRLVKLMWEVLSLLTRLQFLPGVAVELGSPRWLVSSLLMLILDGWLKRVEVSSQPASDCTS